MISGLRPAELLGSMTGTTISFSQPAARGSNFTPIWRGLRHTTRQVRRALPLPDSSSVKRSGTIAASSASMRADIGGIRQHATMQVFALK